MQKEILENDVIEHVSGGEYHLNICPDCKSKSTKLIRIFDGGGTFRCRDCGREFDSWVDYSDFGVIKKAGQ